MVKICDTDHKNMLGNTVELKNYRDHLEAYLRYYQTADSEHFEHIVTSEIIENAKSAPTNGRMCETHHHMFGNTVEQKFTEITLMHT